MAKKYQLDILKLSNHCGSLQFAANLSVIVGQSWLPSPGNANIDHY